MANLNNYTPVYVRTTGNDSTGNGSSGSPYRTAGRAFAHALFAGGTAASAPTQERLEVTVDFGEGNAQLTINENAGTHGGEFDNFVEIVIDVAESPGITDSASLATALAGAYSGAGGLGSATASGNIVIFTAVIDTNYSQEGGYDFFSNNVGGSAYSSHERSSQQDNPGTLGSGNYVLDFGAGSFSGVNLRSVARVAGGYMYYYNPNWPSRIAVRGVGASQSLMGGVDGDGFPAYVNTAPNPFNNGTATNGRDIYIVSDGTVNLGNMTSSGAPESSYTDENVTEFWDGGASAGSITLVDCVCGSVTAAGGVVSNNPTPGTAGSGGSITLTGTTCSNINSYGADAPGSWAGNGAAGSGGSVTLTNCSVMSINAKGGDDSYGIVGVGGDVTATDTFVGGSINVSYGTDGSTFYEGGSVTLAGSTTVPTSIDGASVVTMTNLRKGRGVNGSSILGLV